MKEGIFEKLMKRMLERPPYPYKKFYLSTTSSKNLNAVFTIKPHSISKT